MKKQLFRRSLRWFLAAIILAGTSFLFFFNEEANISPTDKLHKTTNSIYYWRTVFDPSKDELNFLKKHDIGRMYIRMFDVVDGKDLPIPNATISFKQRVPDDIEIVPTIFITVEAIRYANESDGIPTLAKRIVERVENICDWNDITNWNEIQLDCDWTEQTKYKFFLLCEHVRKRLPNGKLLSSTIRLHQLRQSAPPVDYGVLMVYNTDNFRNPKTENSILNENTVKQYLSQKVKLNIPLDIALPIYQWNLEYDKNGNFIRISLGNDLDEETEIVKQETVPYETLEKTQSLLKSNLNLQSNRYSTILYHLNTKNIEHYNDEQIQNLYNN